MRCLSSFIFFFVFFVHQSNAQNFDINLLDKINSPVNVGVDKRWETFSDLNYGISAAAPITMFIVAASTKNQELKIKSYEAGASTILAYVLNSSIKRIVKRDRPYETYPDIIYQKTSASGYSFPSGHSATAFATATSLSLAFPKWYVIVPSYTYACAMAYSRMYLGVHYPTDVIGGMVIGAGSSYLVLKAEKWLNRKSNH